MKNWTSVFVALAMLPLLWAWNAPDQASTSMDELGQMADAGKGLAVFKAKGCNSCHSVTSKGIKVDGEVDKDAEVQPPDLSKIGGKIGTPEDFGKFMIKKAKRHGRKHPKKFKGSDEQLADLTAWLLTLK